VPTINKEATGGDVKPKGEQRERDARQKGSDVGIVSQTSARTEIELDLHVPFPHSRKMIRIQLRLRRLVTLKVYSHVGLLSVHLLLPTPKFDKQHPSSIQ
ncbi:hypothetical protein L7F22_054848, partial [Adiantum nelumboides]|nr:hypothetical protein [Adiantum nelumboides]